MEQPKMFYVEKKKKFLRKHSENLQKLRANTTVKCTIGKALAL